MDNQNERPSKQAQDEAKRQEIITAEAAMTPVQRALSQMRRAWQSRDIL